MLFISAREKVREERRYLRSLSDRLWREDYISRKFDVSFPDKVPGDVLGLRRLFNIEQFPGFAEDERWSALWEFFTQYPLLMLFVIGFYRRTPKTPALLVRSHSF